eukprot:Protomagalhaensia_wolfi_Nauph_80__2713@NODE_2845_length_970_cov_33_559613_g2232_i0_p2_GENE_NODE_2845_length_970_cov_33_559613_g2232_i0NODE_2845_length_970_cov_33_559613_g2232_i0_p2_ORF_typecomplete_len168_score26_86KicB/PF03882_14/0_037_NODE_2845_length_970_cov_33_559613_g2232_i0283786
MIDNWRLCFVSSNSRASQRDASKKAALAAKALVSRHFLYRFESLVATPSVSVNNLSNLALAVKALLPLALILAPLANRFLLLMAVDSVLLERAALRADNNSSKSDIVRPPFNSPVAVVNKSETALINSLRLTVSAIIRPNTDERTLSKPAARLITASDQFMPAPLIL